MSRGLLFALAFIAVVGALAVTDARSITDIQARAQQFRDAGAAVMVLDALGSVDGQRCEAIAASRGAQGSGGVRPGESITALALPSARLTVHEVSTGLLAVIAEAAPITDGSCAHSPGVWLTADLATTLGAAPGEYVATTGDPLPVAGVFEWPDDGRDRDFGFSVLAPVSAAGTFDRCMTAFWPVSRDVTGVQMFAADTHDMTQVTQSPLNGSLGTELDVTALLASRVTAWAPLVAIVAGLGLGLIAVRLRRLEIASALHAGIAKPHVIWIHVLQVAAWTLIAAVATAALAGVLSRAASTATWQHAWGAAIHIIGAAALTTPLGAGLAVLATPESHLFRYFKDR